MLFIDIIFKINLIEQQSIIFTGVCVVIKKIINIKFKLWFLSKNILHDIFNILDMPHSVNVKKNSFIISHNKLTAMCVIKIPLILTIAINKKIKI